MAEYITPEEIDRVLSEYAERLAWFDHVTWRFNPRMRTAMGKCKFERTGKLQGLEFNPNVWESTNDKERLECIVHELCHAAAGPGVGHGRKWKDLMRMCGFEPHRTVQCAALNAELLGRRRPQRRHEYRCGCRAHLISTRRQNLMAKGHRYACRRCGKEIK